MREAQSRLDRGEQPEIELTQEDFMHLSDSGVLRDHLGLPIIDPNDEMHPYLARGYGFDHGELHRVLYYDPVVSGAFTFVAMEVMRAYYALEEFDEETEEERELRGLLMHAYGLGDYTSSIAGGLRQLLFHAAHKVIYGFSLTEVVWGVTDHVDLPEPEPEPEPVDPMIASVPEGREPLNSTRIEDGATEPSGGKTADGKEEQKVEMSDGTRKNKPESIASATAKIKSGTSPDKEVKPGDPGADGMAPPPMVNVKLKAKAPPKPKPTRKVLLPVKAPWIAPWSVARWVWHEGEVVGVLQYHPWKNHDGSGNLAVPTPEKGGAKKSAGLPKATVGEEGVSGGSLPETGVWTYVPLKKCLLFQHFAVDGNPEGRGMRAPYPWVCAKLDTLARDQAAMDLGYKGVIHVRETGENGVPHRTLSYEDGVEMRRALDAHRDGLTNRIVTPYGIEIDTEWPGYDVPDHVDLYKYFDHQILMSVMSGFLGVDAKGVAKGLSEGMAAVAYHMVEAVADDICDVIDGNGHDWTGLSKRIQAANLPNYKGRIPKIIPMSIRYQDLDLMTKIQSRAAQFLLYTPGVEDEVDFRRAARLRNLSKTQIRTLREQVAARNGQSIQSSQSIQNQPVKPGEGTQTGDADYVEAAKESSSDAQPKKPSPGPAGK